MFESIALLTFAVGSLIGVCARSDGAAHDGSIDGAAHDKRGNLLERVFSFSLFFE